MTFGELLDFVYDTTSRMDVILTRSINHPESKVFVDSIVGQNRVFDIGNIPFELFGLPIVIEDENVNSYVRPVDTMEDFLNIDDKDLIVYLHVRGTLRPRATIELERYRILHREIIENDESGVYKVKLSVVRIEDNKEEN